MHIYLYTYAKTEWNSKENLGVRTTAIFLLLRIFFKESKSNTPLHITELDLYYLLNANTLFIVNSTFFKTFIIQYDTDII
jgi:hypothetical protein